VQSQGPGLTPEFFYWCARSVFAGDDFLTPFAAGACTLRILLIQELGTYAAKSD
jgi:hypothetical protein